jgi:DUF2946 family protein
MRLRFFSAPTQRWIISLLLVVLCVRALIPAGFMPSSERPFTLEICPDGFPSQLLHSPAAQNHDADGGMVGHHHHAGGGPEQAPASTHPGQGPHEQSVRAEHCVFAASAGAALAPHPLLIVVEATPSAAPAIPPVSFFADSQRHRVQQPRAPPALS